MNARILFPMVAALFGTAMPVAAQFSSDIPGVPRASVPLRGGHQNRTVWDLSYFAPGSGAHVGSGIAAGEDAQAAVARLGFGQSYRIGSRFEVGFDLVLVDGFHVRPATTDSASSGSSGSSRAARPASFSSGVFLDAPRLGGKFRPIQMLSPEGYGFEAAVGVGYQPALRPVFGVVVDRDTMLTGGMLKQGEEERGTPLFAGSRAGYQLAGMLSYRQRRFSADAAAIYDGEVTTSDGEGTSLSRPSVSKFNPRIGAQVRILPWFAAGASWWGNGAAPWSGRQNSRLPVEKQSQFTPFITLGSKPEAGWDLILVSPTGVFAESARLYIRARSTR